MGLPSIQYFRKEDFPEVADQPWTAKLFDKLNSMARQNQYALSNNISVSQNLSGFWWDGIIGNYTAYPSIILPFQPATAPTITIKNAQSIQAFPFNIVNKISPKPIKGVFVARAIDVTDTSVAPVPALLGSVAWTEETDGATGQKQVKIYAINGMFTGRSYQTTLLLLSE